MKVDTRLGFERLAGVRLNQFLFPRNLATIRLAVVADAHARGATPQHEGIVRKIDAYNKGNR